MGLAERDYSRRASSSSGLSALREWSATTWLIAILIAGFLLEAILTPPLPIQLMQMTRDPLADVESGQFTAQFLGPFGRHAHFSIARVREMQVWRVASFPFVHTDAWPLLMCIVCLIVFARPLEAETGAGPLVALFGVCCLAAPATYVALHAAGVGITGPWLPLIGAGAGVLGIVVAAALAGPDDDVTMWSTGVSIPRRTLAWVAAALFALVLIKQDSTGANAAHLGGAVAGLACAPLVRRLV
jgi:membrane associated rhomboid family serine protease